jgi:hypothetical protein
MSFIRLRPSQLAKAGPERPKNPAITGTYSKETAAIRTKPCNINRSLKSKGTNPLRLTRPAPSAKDKARHLRQENFTSLPLTVAGHVPN